MLVARWGVFWGAMSAPLHRVHLIVLVCMKLHNICIEANLQMGLGEQVAADTMHKRPTQEMCTLKLRFVNRAKGRSLLMGTGFGKGENRQFGIEL